MNGTCINVVYIDFYYTALYEKTCLILYIFGQNCVKFGVSLTNPAFAGFLILGVSGENRFFTKRIKNERIAMAIFDMGLMSNFRNIGAK